MTEGEGRHQPEQLVPFAQSKAGRECDDKQDVVVTPKVGNMTDAEAEVRQEL